MSLALVLVAMGLGATLDGGTPASDDVDGGSIVHVMDEKEMIAVGQTDQVRLSLPTEDDGEAWENPGLRVALGYGYLVLRGSGPAWSFNSQSVALRPSVRIDRYWEVGTTLLYGTGPNGLRWSVTAEPSFHPVKRLAVGLGLGYGGLSISDPNRSSGNLRGPDEAVSRTLSDDERLQSCTGSALSGLGRAEYLFVVGPLFSTGPYVQAQAQWTRCEVQFGRVDQETGKPIVLTQWWRQQGAMLGWWFTWR
jgi:hypothetical protein